LLVELPVPFEKLALGGEVRVPTIDGYARLKLAPGTESGKVFRLRDKGVTPVRGGPPGDLLCRVVVETPVNLTKRQKELLNEFRDIADSHGDKQNPRRSGWFDGVKSFVDSLKS
jgi:molecular chaperone DnaJ